jgi:hypothetical protein
MMTDEVFGPKEPKVNIVTQANKILADATARPAPPRDSAMVEAIATLLEKNEWRAAPYIAAVFDNLDRGAMREYFHRKGYVISRADINAAISAARATVTS